MVRTFVHVRNPKTVATPICVRTRTLRSKYRRLSDTLLRYHQNEALTCFLLLAATTSPCLPVGRKLDFTSLFSASFLMFRLPDQVQNHWLAWKTTTNCIMDFLSTVKVKLVGSLIWRPFILSWIRPRPIWHMCDFLFRTIRSLESSNFCTFIVALCNNCY